MKKNFKDIAARCAALLLMGAMCLSTAACGTVTSVDSSAVIETEAVETGCEHVFYNSECYDELELAYTVYTCDCGAQFTDKDELDAHQKEELSTISNSSDLSVIGYSITGHYYTIVYAAYICKKCGYEYSEYMYTYLDGELIDGEL